MSEEILETRVVELLVQHVKDRDYVEIKGDPVNNKADREEFMVLVLDNELGLEEQGVIEFIDLCENELQFTDDGSLRHDLLVETEPGDLDVAMLVRNILLRL